MIIFCVKCKLFEFTDPKEKDFLGVRGKHGSSGKFYNSVEPITTLKMLVTVPLLVVFWPVFFVLLGFFVLSIFLCFGQKQYERVLRVLRKLLCCDILHLKEERDFKVFPLTEEEQQQIDAELENETKHQNFLIEKNRALERQKPKDGGPDAYTHPLKIPKQQEEQGPFLGGTETRELERQQDLRPDVQIK